MLTGVSETRSQAGRVPGQAMWRREADRLERCRWRLGPSGEVGLGDPGPGSLEEPLTPILCLGMSTELSLQQDDQDPGPEEALGERPLPDLLGAGGGRQPAHHPDCAAGHLSPTKQRGQQCLSDPGRSGCLGAQGLTQLGLEEGRVATLAGSGLQRTLVFAPI